MSYVGCRALDSLHNAGLEPLEGIRLTVRLLAAGIEVVLRLVAAAKPRLAR